jgi:hypothetical protein
VKAEEVSNFLTALDSAQDLTPLDKIVMKDKFFRQRVTVDPDWNQAPPEQRFAFAKKYGISPGLAQLGEGEFYAAGLLPKPQGDLGEVHEPNPFNPSETAGALLDPTNAITGGAANLLGRGATMAGRFAPQAAKTLGVTGFAENPLIKGAMQRGLGGTMLDWQTGGLDRLPGAVWRGGKSLADLISRLRTVAPQAAAPGSVIRPPLGLPAGQPPLSLPPMGGTGGPYPAASSPFPMGPSSLPPPMRIPPSDWLAR